MSSILESLRTEAYTTSQKTYKYFAERDLFDTKEGGIGYNTLLPTWGEKRLAEIVDEKIRLNHSRPVVIVDFGCGPKGKFLQGCSKQWGSAIVGYGINSNFHDVNINQLRQDGINLIEGDVVKAHELLKGIKADVITSLRVFPYLVDPWQTVRIIDYLLNRGGIALLDSVPVSAVIQELDFNEELRNSFFNFLRKQGVEVNESEDISWQYRFLWYCNLAWKKTNLNIPLSYSGIVDQRVHVVNAPYALYPEDYDFIFKSVGYKVVKEKLR